MSVALQIMQLSPTLMKLQSLLTICYHGKKHHAVLYTICISGDAKVFVLFLEDHLLDLRLHENGITQLMQFHLSDLRLSLKGCHLCQGSNRFSTAYMRILPDHHRKNGLWIQFSNASSLYCMAYKKLLNCVAYTRHAERSRLELALATNGSEAAPAPSIKSGQTPFSPSYIWCGHLALMERWQGNYLQFLFALLPAHVVATGEMARDKACLEVSSVGPIPETLLAVGMNAGMVEKGWMKMKNRL